MEERKIIVFKDDNGMVRAALTQDQLKLLNWLHKYDWLYSELYYQEEDEAEII
jgi:hypothetical protein